MSNQYTTLKSIDSVAGRYNATEDARDYATLLVNTSNCRPIKDVIETGMEAIHQLHQLAHVKTLPDELGNSADQEEQFLRWRENKFIHVRRAVQEFVREASSLASMARQVPATDIPSVIASENPGFKSRASAQMEADAYYRIAMHKESLRVLRKAMDRNWKEIIQKTDESIRILNEIHSWKMEEINFERAIEMLEMGMTQMSELKENWALLVRFFAGLSYMIEVIGGKYLHDFTHQLETTANSTSLYRSGQLNDLVVAKIRAKTTRAIQATSLISGMASTYCRISSDYLMPRIHTLDLMMKFESSSNLAVDRINLLNSCTDDSMKIRELIAHEKQHWVDRIGARVHQIRKEYAFLDELETQAIRQADIDNFLSYY